MSGNKFFDAPAQSPECLSFGVQTSPYTFVTSVIAKLKNPPASATNQIDTAQDQWPESAVVPIYRQWRLAADKAAEDKKPCGPVCDGNDVRLRPGDLPRHHGHPPGVVPDHDRPARHRQQPAGRALLHRHQLGAPVRCRAAERANLTLASFLPENSYVLYNLWPQVDSQTSYQLYVGDGVKQPSDIGFRYVRVQAHVMPTVPNEVAAQVVEVAVRSGPAEPVVQRDAEARHQERRAHRDARPQEACRQLRDRRAWRHRRLRRAACRATCATSTTARRPASAAPRAIRSASGRTISCPPTSRR